MSDPAGGAPRRVTIVITNYNGRENLAIAIPAALRAAAHGGLGAATIVVDDGSDDGSAGFVREAFPAVLVVALPERSGFARAANAGVHEARTPLVALLSNDMVPHEGFLAPLLRHMERTDVFAACSRLEGPDGAFESGRTLGVFLAGGLVVANSARGYSPLGWLLGNGRQAHATPPDDVAAVPTLFTGGNAIFDRAKFLDLGGFDDLFLPFYWEDTDLCYRAWKRGYITVYDPSSRVVHDRARGTIRRRYPGEYVRLIRKRNRLLFTWKNVCSPVPWAQHLLFLGLQSILAWAWGDLMFYRALRAALPLAHQALERRRRESALACLGDGDVLRRVRAATLPDPLPAPAVVNPW